MAWSYCHGVSSSSSIVRVSRLALHSSKGIQPRGEQRHDIRPYISLNTDVNDSKCHVR